MAQNTTQPGAAQQRYLQSNTDSKGVQNSAPLYVVPKLKSFGMTLTP